MENTPLQNAEIKVKNIKLVEKGKEPNTWKEYQVEVANFEKGIYYNLPIKKSDGKFTKAYTIYLENRDRWEKSFIEGKTVDLAIGYSEKQVAWSKEGKSGTTSYRTIRFLEEIEMIDESYAPEIN